MSATSTAETQLAVAGAYLDDGARSNKEGVRHLGQNGLNGRMNCETSSGPTKVMCGVDQFLTYVCNYGDSQDCHRTLDMTNHDLAVAWAQLPCCEQQYDW